MRHLAVVIDQMLEVIPADKTESQQRTNRVDEDSICIVKYVIAE